MRNVGIVVKGLLPADSERLVDRQARLTRLVAVNFDFIWRVLRRLGVSNADVDDAAQLVFMVATRRIESIADGSERRFLYATAIRVAAGLRRSARRRREDPDASVDTRAASTPAPDQEAELKRACSLMDELLEQLPPELRRVLMLAELEQLEVAEIACLERVPVGTAASRLRRARARFREQLGLVRARIPFGNEAAP